MSIIQPTPPVAVQISARPDTPPIVVQAYVDPHSAPPGTDQTSIAFGVLCLAVAWNRAVIMAMAQRLSILEVAAASREILDGDGATSEELAAARERYRIAITTIKMQAATIELGPPKPANDDADSHAECCAPAGEGGEESRAPASALDAIDPAAI